MKDFDMILCNKLNELELNKVIVFIYLEYFIEDEMD